MFDRTNRRLDLAPPVFTALEMIEVTIEGQPLGLEQSLQAASELKAVLARVGDEYAPRVGVAHRRSKYSSKARRPKALCKPGTPT